MSVTFIKSRYIQGTPILISSRVLFATVLAPDKTFYNSYWRNYWKLINGPRSDITVGTMLCPLANHFIIITWYWFNPGSRRDSTETLLTWT